MKPNRWKLAIGMAGTLLFPAIVDAKQDKKKTQTGDTAETSQQTQEQATVVTFESDSARLDDQAKQTLDQIATWLEQGEGRELVIEGHPGWAGAPDHKQDLARQRTEAIREYISDQIEEPLRVSITPFGERTTMMTTSDRTVVHVTTRGIQFNGQSTNGEELGQMTTPPPTTMAEEDFDQSEIERQDVEMYEQTAPVWVESSKDARTDADNYDSQARYVWQERPAHLVTPAGLGVSLGGGVVQFTDSDSNDFTSLGGSWDVRIDYGTRSFVAVEAAYIGSAQDIDALGLASGAALLGNGAEGAIRINMLRGAIQPYIFGGAGWTNYQIVGADFNLSALRDSDNIFHVPTGVGIGYRYRGFMVDVRGTMRFAFGNDLMDAATADTGANAKLHTLNLGARIGWEM